MFRRKKKYLKHTLISQLVDLKVNSGAQRGGQLDKGYKSYEESKNIVHFHLELHVSNVELREVLQILTKNIEPKLLLLVTRLKRWNHQRKKHPHERYPEQEKTKHHQMLRRLQEHQSLKQMFPRDYIPPRKNYAKPMMLKNDAKYPLVMTNIPYGVIINEDMLGNVSQLRYETTTSQIQ